MQHLIPNPIPIPDTFSGGWVDGLSGSLLLCFSHALLVTLVAQLTFQDRASATRWDNVTKSRSHYKGGAFLVVSPLWDRGSVVIIRGGHYN